MRALLFSLGIVLSVLLSATFLISIGDNLGATIGSGVGLIGSLGMIITYGRKEYE